MSHDDPLQQNIRRTAGLHALKKIRCIVTEEDKNDAASARALRGLLRYGWIVLLFAILLLASLMGVY